MFFQLFKDRGGSWRWTLYAPNNRKIADCAEGYNNKQDAVHGIDLVKGTSYATPVHEQ